MREIKFRAYLKEDGVMLYSENDVDDVLMEIWRIGSVGCKIEVQQERCREGGGEVYTTTEYVEADAEIMQYTGLKDKNGKEIYEDDIITMSTGKPIAVIKYHYCGFVFQWIDPIYITLRKQNEPIFRNVHLFKVLGNIHENPELLP